MYIKKEREAYFCLFKITYFHHCHITVYVFTMSTYIFNTLTLPPPHTHRVANVQGRASRGHIQCNFLGGSNCFPWTRTICSHGSMDLALEGLEECRVLSVRKSTFGSAYKRDRLGLCRSIKFTRLTDHTLVAQQQRHSNGALALKSSLSKKQREKDRHTPTRKYKHEHTQILCVPY